MGYGNEQLQDLENTINNTDCDGVIIATPIDLSREININKPYTRVYYKFEAIGKPDLYIVLDPFLSEKGLLK